jgi:Mitochondrial carrier protein
MANTKTTNASINAFSKKKDEEDDHADTSFLVSYGQSIVRLARTEGWNGLLAGATPRIVKAFISGAIQFATYEETKHAIANMFFNMGR